MSSVNIKRIGLSVAALIGLFVVALGVMSALINRDSMREAVERQIRAVTGLDLTVRGGITTSLFPAGTMTFRDVRLKGDTGDQPALYVDELTANLRVLPLLAYRFEISDIALARPRMVVTRKTDGSSNWSAILLTLLDQFKSRIERSSSFSEIRIQDGELIYRDEARDRTELIQDIDISLAWPSIARSFGATGQVIWRDKRIDASITVGDFLAALAGQRSSLKLRLNNPAFKVAFDGTFAAKPDIMMEGALSVGSSALRDTLQWLGHPPPSDGGFERFTLASTIQMVGTTVNLTKTNLDIDGNVAEGALSLNLQERLNIQGTLAADAIDLSPYLSSARAPSATSDWSRASFKYTPLDRYDLDLRCSAARVTLGTQKIGRTAVAANLTKGNLTLSIGEAQVFGGLAKGSISAQPTDDGIEARSQFQFLDIDLADGANSTFGIRKIEGRGNLSFALSAMGRSLYEMTRTLNGNVLLTSESGTLIGVNIEQLLRRLEKRPLSGGGDFRNGRTPFQTLNAALHITDGIAITDDMRIESSAIRLQLMGQASVPTRELDIKGSASLVAPSSASAGGFDLPFIMQGPWTNPVILPDPEILIRRSRASAPLLDAAREQRLRDKLRSAVEKMTSGKDAGNPAPAQPSGDAAPAASSNAAPPADSQTPSASQPQ